MGFNYNGKLRPKELLLRMDGSVELIRREETAEDYFATLNVITSYSIHYTKLYEYAEIGIAQVYQERPGIPGVRIRSLSQKHGNGA